MELDEFISWRVTGGRRMEVGSPLPLLDGGRLFWRLIDSQYKTAAL
jgi:hypothetical protein